MVKENVNLKRKSVHKFSIDALICNNTTANEDQEEIIPPSKEHKSIPTSCHKRLDDHGSALDSKKIRPTSHCLSSNDVSQQPVSFQQFLQTPDISNGPPLQSWAGYLPYMDYTNPLGHLQTLHNSQRLTSPQEQRPIWIPPHNYVEHLQSRIFHPISFSSPINSPENHFYYPISLRRQKRIRTAFSPTQLMQLEKSFETTKYLVGHERKQLARKLNLTETQIKVWFQNRRTKTRRTDGISEPDSHITESDRKSLHTKVDGTRMSESSSESFNDDESSYSGAEEENRTTVNE